MKKILLSIALLVSCSGYAAEDLMSKEAITARTAPVGQVNISGEEAAAVTTPAAEKKVAEKRTGKDIYQKHCHVCHASGMAGAPKVGNAADWKPRVAKGLDTLVSNANKGINAMPAKGTCSDCNDDELKAAIEFMLPK